MKILFRTSLVTAFFLAACGSAPATPVGITAATPSLAATPAVARTIITYVPSEGIGNIAVMVAYPKTARYSPGAGVVVIASPILDGSAGFQTDPDVTRLGLIRISYLWPGESDARTHARSDGQFDAGGETSTAALRDVLRFACGLIPDKDGRYITNLTNLFKSPVLTGEVGLYAFADAGIPAITTLSLYGDQMQNVQYYVGRENPTGDTLANLEPGYWDANGQPVVNPNYKFTVDYNSDEIKLDYTNLRWDPSYKNSLTGAVGRPYLDLDGNGSFGPGDFAFNDRVLTISGKRYYSAALTQALLDKGALTLANWPADMATPQEAAQAWQYRQVLTRFQDLGNKIHTLNVMLVFAIDDHALVAPDKPHIHQMYQGLRFEAWQYGYALGLWVRLNPDRAYVQSLNPGAGTDYPDNPANTQPSDWNQIGMYAYPDQGNVDGIVPLAAVAEMADRTHSGDWVDMNLGQALYAYPPLP